jgi:hypothetical protein
MRRVASALEIDIEIVPRWRGSSVDRLVDRAHAGLVDGVVGRLDAAGFEVIAEWSFNHFGERGAVDVVDGTANRVPWQSSRSRASLSSPTRRFPLSIDTSGSRRFCCRPNTAGVPPGSRAC